MEETPQPVKLYIYDLSGGLAPHLSQWLLRKQIEAIWHTSIVIFDREYYFGQNGIVDCEPASTNLGPPKKIELLGETYITEDIFKDYLQGLKQSSFAIGTYNLLKHNCNTFSNELSNFLVGKSIPSYILDLPNEVIETIVGQEYSPLALLLSDFVHSCRDRSPDYEQLNNDIEQARLRSLALEQQRCKITEKLERQERKKKKKSKKKKKGEREYSVDSCNELSNNNNSGSSKSRNKTYNMAENVNGCTNGETSNTVSSQVALDIDEQESREKAELKKLRQPPVIFQNVVNIQDEFDKVIGLVDDKLIKEEMQYLEELHQYMLEDEGSWALSDGFLSFIGNLLKNANYPNELKVHLLNLLSMAALKEDIILVLHQDRREHVFMNYAHQFDKLLLDLQKPLALFVCNLFENPSSSEWLLYISEWEAGTNNMISNIRVTTKIAVNALLSDNNELQNYGTAIVHNLACKEKMQQNLSLRKMLPVGSVWKVFDDVAVELTMALLQFFNNASNEEYIFRSMKALAKFVQISPQEVVQLIQMIGPQPSKFRGMSERIDSHIAAIDVKLSK